MKKKIVIFLVMAILAGVALISVSISLKTPSVILLVLGVILTIAGLTGFCMYNELLKGIKGGQDD